MEDADLELTASCVLAAAELGCSHNRWYVMGRLLAMCGPELSDTTAQRIQIEIRAGEAEVKFRRCAEVIGREYDDYHPLIAELLKES